MKDAHRDKTRLLGFSKIRDETGRDEILVSPRIETRNWYFSLRVANLKVLDATFCLFLPFSTFLDSIRAPKPNISNFALPARWVETYFWRDETRREILRTKRDKGREKLRLEMRLETIRDFKVIRNSETRRERDEKFLVSSREIETRNFSTHP